MRIDGKPDNRRNWHPACFAAGQLAVNSKVQREACFARDKGVCARCKTDLVANYAVRAGVTIAWAARYLLKHGGDYWQADHILPLIEAEGRLEYFTLANLQTLCTPCHVAKGKEDNARRREAQKIAHQLSFPIEP